MKTVLITGGGGEIGAAIIREFEAQNYRVIAPTRAQMDLSDENSINAYLKTSKDAVDVFVHCAGINDPKPFDEIAPSDFDKTLTINARSLYMIVSHLATEKKLKQNGHILGISSIFGYIARKKRFSYIASKYCLNGMIKSLALELAEKGIKVNALSPGFVATKMTYKNNTPEVLDRLTKKIPLAKMAEAEDIAKIAYFLCSDKNTYITGQNIIADGGYTSGGSEE
jgi:3-oxoacyl-[acyl-carrier protein] reductase